MTRFRDRDSGAATTRANVRARSLAIDGPSPHHPETTASPTSACTILRARFVFPVVGPPLPDAAVVLSGGRVIEVARWRSLSAASRNHADVVDVGNAAILPGLINAHTHLELSHLQQPLGSPGTPLVDWLGGVVVHRRDSAPPAEVSIASGLEESLRSGVTTLADIVQPASLRGRAAAPVSRARQEGNDAAPIIAGESAYVRSPLRKITQLELIGPQAHRVEPAIAAAERFVDAATTQTGSMWRRAIGGLSPHAPYSVHPALLDRTIGLAKRANLLVAMHLAESLDEIELMETGGGRFRERLMALAAWEPANYPGGQRPRHWLERLAEARRALVIHGNYLSDDEIDLLAQSPTTAVVYCPRTHTYFGHPHYPLARMLDRGVTVALGTDSRASSPDLGLLRELRYVAGVHQDVAANDVLSLATARAATALGLHDTVGTLQTGMQGDLAVVALPERDEADPFALLFDSDLPVVQTWIAGRRAWISDGDAGGHGVEFLNDS